MGGQLIKVKFYGDQLWGYRQDDDVFVGVKPIVEGMGLAWNGQLERLKRDPILNEGMRITRIPSSGGDQEAVCLRLHLVPGWLSGVDANRVKPDLRDKVILYQRECYDVLAAHFLNGGLRQDQLDQLLFYAKDTNDLIRKWGPKRFDFPAETERLYVEVIDAPPYCGRCPIYRDILIVKDGERTDESTIDHANGRNNVKICDGWLTSKLANRHLENPEFREKHRDAFKAFQINLKLLVEYKDRKQQELHKLFNQKVDRDAQPGTMTTDEWQSYRQRNLF